MKLKEAMKELEALGTDKMRAQNINHGAKGKQFGVRRGDIRKVAKKAKTDHELGLALWDTENHDARFLATLILKPKNLSAKEVDKMVRSEDFVESADWFRMYVVKKHPDKESLREKWMKAKNTMSARAGWALTADRVAKEPDGLDLKGLLDRVEKEMGSANEKVQWTMNMALVEIGIHHPKLRKRALAIGEKLGLYGDWPTVKGCTSPYAPTWINEMVKRQG